MIERLLVARLAALRLDHALWDLFQSLRASDDDLAAAHAWRAALLARAPQLDALDLPRGGPAAMLATPLVPPRAVRGVEDPRAFAAACRTLGID